MFLLETWDKMDMAAKLGWAGEITAVGLGTVIIMLLVLMVFLMIITALFPPSADEDEAEDEPEAPAAAAPVATDELTDDDLAAIAAAVHFALGHGGPALTANKSGSGLADSRWVSIGRSTMNHTWQRS
ncbi:MAG: OadG family protein [Propionibacteriaceae bacterium]|jgi:sodium pump decarboxylase gamma subunit|nr:OadG family protein [Propionibacteriaceae bacterium]